MSEHKGLVRAVSAGLLTILAVPFLTGLSIPASVSNAKETGPIRKIGDLPDAAFGPKRGDEGAIAAVHSPSRRMFYVYTDAEQYSHVVTYDLNPRIPKPIAVGPLAPEVNVFPPSPYSVAFDSKRKQLVFITGNVDVDGHAVTLGNPSISVYSDTTHKVSATWNITAKLPGFYPFGITYSEKDDRLYLVGEFAGSQYVAASTYTFGSKAVGAAASVVALDPATGDVHWMRQLPMCQQALFTLNTGGLIARSRHRDALYFACVTGGTANGKTYPGQAGVVRLHIDPKANESATAAAFPYDFYAISGNYFNGAASGIAAFDPHTDRFFLQSLAPKTPGAWTFDGKLSAWVGLIPAPSPADRFVGVNERLGHLYMGTFQGGEIADTDGILVSDVRQTPPTAGEFVPIVTNAFIATDAATRRLFVQPHDASSTLAPYGVYEDVSPVTDGLTTVDYDADTTDTPDAPGAQVSYSAGAAGYGMQAVQVGGTGGAGSAIGTPDIEGVAQGTRATMASRLNNLDLRAQGASATTQAVVADINTEQHYERQRGEAWPYRTTHCLDSGGAPSEDTYTDSGTTGPANGGTSGVACDLAKNSVKAWARMGAAGSGMANAGRTSYTADARRNTAEGVVVTTRAAAESITFDVLGGYSLRIGKVVATASSVAHGRPGTTESHWKRDVDGIEITNAAGDVVQRVPGCESSIDIGPTTSGKPVVKDTCVDLGDKLSRILPTRIKISMPLPAVTATPRGAFAGVEQGVADYFQQRVMNDQGVVYRVDSVGVRPAPAAIVETYNDSTERSRTVTVLAATQTNAVFTVVPAHVDPPQPPVPSGEPTETPFTPGGNEGPPVLRPNDSDDGDGGNGVAQPTAAAGNGNTVASPDTELSGYFFLRRSARDAVLLVLLAGLLLSGAGTYWRRRRLVQVLVTVPGKEAS